MRALDVLARDLKASGQRVVFWKATPTNAVPASTTWLWASVCQGRFSATWCCRGVPALLELVSYGKERTVAVVTTKLPGLRTVRVELKSNKRCPAPAVLDRPDPWCTVVAGAQFPVQDVVIVYGVAQSALGKAMATQARPVPETGLPVSRHGSTVHAVATVAGRYRSPAWPGRGSGKRDRPAQAGRIGSLPGSGWPYFPAFFRACQCGRRSRCRCCPGWRHRGQQCADAPASAGSPAASSEPGDPAKEKLYYDAAFDLIKAKDFDKASQAFNAFLRKYPNSQYAGNAQYWLGEVNLAGRSAGCWPGLRQGQSGLSHQQQGAGFAYKTGCVEQSSAAPIGPKGMYHQVISQYPGTSAANWRSGI